MSFESISGLSDIGNVSIIVAVVAALLYYFGILIGDTQVEKYEKTASYIEGLAFSIKYIAAPFVLIMLFVNFTGLRIPFWWGVGTQVIINSLLGSVIFASQYIKKYGLQGKIKSIAHQETERLVEANRLLAKIDEDRKKTSQKTVEEAISFSYYELPTKYLGNKYIFFLSSLIIIWGFYSYLPNFQFLKVILSKHYFLKLKNPNLKVSRFHRVMFLTCYLINQVILIYLISLFLQVFSIGY